MSVTKSARFITQWPALGLLIFFAAMPVYGPFMVYIEGDLLPVTSKITVTSQTPANGGLDITFSYTKYRFCELEGFDARAGQLEVPMTIAPVSATPSPVRTPGYQGSRVWHIGAASMDGISLWFIHRCNPLWLTATKVYP